MKSEQGDVCVVWLDPMQKLRVPERAGPESVFQALALCPLSVSACHGVYGMPLGHGLDVKGRCHIATQWLRSEMRVWSYLDPHLPALAPLSKAPLL